MQTKFWIVISTFLMCSLCQASTFYVSPSGNDANAGTSWAMAKKTVQSAIDLCVRDDVVWVGDGTYTSYSTIVARGVTVKSLNGPNAAIFNNPYFSLLADSCLDGFTIQNCYVSDDDQIVSGVKNTGGTMQNCVIRYCRSKYGSDETASIVWNATGNNEWGILRTGIVDNCHFYSNTNLYMGHTVYNKGGVLKNSYIYNNRRAIYNPGGVVKDCVITGNINTNALINYSGNGGGVRNGGLIYNCDISSNVAFYGGGVYSSFGEILDCRINGNTSIKYSNGTRGSGGGIYIDEYNSSFVVRCIVENNYAESSGGGVYVENPWSKIYDSVIRNNRAFQFGGGIYNEGCVFNCTIINNTAYWYGGVANNNKIFLSIIWGNSAQDNQYPNVNLPASGYYDPPNDYFRKNCTTPNIDTYGNISSNPMLVGYRLKPNSPCIDPKCDDYSDWQGLLRDYDSVDIDGNPRVINSTFNPEDWEFGWAYEGYGLSDIGAYEFTPLTFHIPQGISASDGTHSDRIDVTWNVASGALYYALYRSTVNDSSKASKISNVSGSSYSDVTALANQMYYYWVKAYYETYYGLCDSGFSNSDSGWYGYTLPPPSSIEASDGIYNDKIRITYSQSSGATKYEIYRADQDDSGKCEKIADTTSLYYDDISVAANTVYYYWVKVRNIAGVGSLSSAATGWCALINPPSSIEASDGIYNDKIRITYSQSSGATKYEIYRADQDDSGKCEKIADTTSLYYDDISVAANTVYYYWVKSVNAAGTSVFSSSDSGYLASLLQLNSSSIEICENDGNVSLLVSRTGGSLGAASVNYTTINGTAIAGLDFSATSGTLSWGNGDSAGKTFSVPILNLARNQGGRSFGIALSGASGACLGSVVQATVTINDFDPDPDTGPSIRANGRRNSVTIDQLQNISLDVTMAAGQHVGITADWWVIAILSYGGEWYYLNSFMQWVSFAAGNFAACQPAYQGGIMDITSPVIVLPAMTLPRGTYIFHFAVDQMDGILNYPDGPILYDSVTVVVE